MMKKFLKDGKRTKATKIYLCSLIFFVVALTNPVKQQMNDEAIKNLGSTLKDGNSRKNSVLSMT